MGSVITYQRPDGKDVHGYLAEPAESSNGASVVVLQEWWGLNDQIRGVADRYAAAGFTALVPDLYRGKSTVEAEEAHHLMSGLDFGDAASQDIRGAVSYLKARGGKVGITGFCMGGALTILASTMTPEADAAVAFYGHPPVDFINAANLTIPVMAHWALDDDFFPIAGVEAVEAKFADAGVRYTGYRYLAKHGFANETAVGPRRIPATQHDPAWTQMAFDRTFTFFAHHLL